MNGNLPVTLCIITRNEAQHLVSCLHSARHLVREIIVVDTSSVDGTQDIAARYGARVFSLPWDEDFAAARNYSLARATGDWIFVLDADEILAPVRTEELAALLAAPGVEGYFVNIRSYLGNGEEVAEDQAVRLFRNRPFYRFEGAIHEQVAGAIKRRNSGGGLACSPLLIHHFGYLDRQVRAKNKRRRNIGVITRSLGKKPDDPFLLYSLGIEYLQDGDTAQGIALLEKALFRTRGSEGYFRDLLVLLCLSLYGAGQKEKLVYYLDGALRMFPADPDLRLLRGVLALGENRYSAAKEEIRCALAGGAQILPRHHVHTLLGNACRSQGRYREAQREQTEGMFMERVLIASPVRQKPAILREFLWSLSRLKTSGLLVEFAFIDDHEEKSDLLHAFAAGRNDVRIFPGRRTGETYHCDENTHHWREDLIWKVAGYKNFFLQLARAEGFDYLFLVDSDLVLHPETLVHLVRLKKDIVSEVYWTRWEAGLPPLPQVWVADQYRLYPLERGEAPDEKEIARRQSEFLEMLRRPGTYKVGGLGACTLISRKAIQLGVSFSEIYNLGLIGEDRHFCVQAAALGLELYADTHYPPYHIYRESELAGLEEYKQKNFPAEIKNDFGAGIGIIAGEKDPSAHQGNSITLAMLVRNEAGRYLEKVLGHAAQYIDRAVILDDASEDDTKEVCKKALQNVPLTLVSNREPAFANEIVLRRQLWKLACATGPCWILILDADEIFEERAVKELPLLAANPEVDVYYFRLYDMWDEMHYREDEYWRAHHYYRPFMVRYLPGFPYRWKEVPLHCGRFPENITELRGAKSSLRVKHLGWMKPADRLAKYYRYKKLDPEGRYGIMAQYRSILDPRPNLVAWKE